MSIIIYDNCCFSGNDLEICDDVTTIKKLDIKHIKSLIIKPLTQVIFYTEYNYHGNYFTLENLSEEYVQKYNKLPTIVNCCTKSVKVKHIESNIDLDDKTFEHTIYLQTEDITRSPYGDPIAVKLLITVNDNIVTIKIPALNMVILEDGYIFTASGNLPKKISPKSTIYTSFSLPSNEFILGYVLHVVDDGSIKISIDGNIPLFPHILSIYATTISYILPTKNICIPKNYILYDKSSNAVQLNSDNDFLDFYNNDFNDKYVAFTWSDNSASPKPYNFGIMSRIGKIIRDDNEIYIKFKKPEKVFSPSSEQLFSGCLENSISINKINVKNIIITSILIDTNELFESSNRLQLIVAVSNNLGKKWNTKRIDNENNLPLFRADPDSLFDIYGNHWIVYLSMSSADPDQPLNVTFVVSSDGGESYELVTELIAPADTFYDYPRIAFGGSGNNNEHCLWFAVTFMNNDSSIYRIVTGYIPVFGLGITNIGSINSAFISVNNHVFPEITATNNGTIFLAPSKLDLRNINGDNGKDGCIDLFTLFGGVNNFPNFIGPTNLMCTNIGINDLSTSTGGKPIPFQSHRGVFPLGARGIGYDPIRNRLWVLGVDMIPDLSNNMIIFLQYSDNNGKTWSDYIQISDSSIGCRALPSISVDQKTGDIAVFWYDSRLDPQNKSVLPFATLFRANNVESFICDKYVKNKNYNNNYDNNECKTDKSHNKPDVKLMLGDKNILSKPEIDTESIKKYIQIRRKKLS